MKKTSIWLSDVEDKALQRLSWERGRSRSHIIRWAIRREAGLDEQAFRATLRGGFDGARGIWIFSAQEELVMGLRNAGRRADEIARELRLPEPAVRDILFGIDRKLDFFGDAWDD
jgi:predicted transcriptional regulator